MPIENADYFLWFACLPPQIHGMLISNGDNTYCVVLNSRDSWDRQLDGYEHELWHIIRDDIYNDKPIEEIERMD